MPEFTREEIPIDGRGTSKKSHKAVEYGLRLYRQIAAAFGALGLAHILETYWRVEWRGPLASVVGLWQGVHAAIAEFFHAVVTVPSGWFGVEVEVPPWFSDYVAVGLIIALASFRTASHLQTAMQLHTLSALQDLAGDRPFPEMIERLPQPQSDLAIGSVALTFHRPRLRLIAGTTSKVFLWPLYLFVELALIFVALYFYWRPVGYKEATAELIARIRKMSRRHLRFAVFGYLESFAPMLYLAALLTVNVLVIPSLS